MCVSYGRSVKGGIRNSDPLTTRPARRRASAFTPLDHDTHCSAMTVNRPCIVLGTHNRKKGRELADLFAPWGVEVRTLADISDPLEVVEDGRTFAANAALKACRQAAHLGAWVLGEDSGLVVDALGGRPGIYSARYSGPDATDASNIARLLDEMRSVPADARGAHYVCHATLADPCGQPRVAIEARCYGRIAASPRGIGGFGYDPVFEIVEYHRTFGELGEAVKAALSHRGRAIRSLVRAARRLLHGGARG